jgi:hypothetical protein
METGFAERSLAGEPPPLPEGEDPDELVRVAVQALADGRREVRYDLKSKELLVK